MGVRYAQNIIEESDPIFFIAAIVALRSPRICSKAFPGYIYILAFLIAYYYLYTITIEYLLEMYKDIKQYSDGGKTRAFQACFNVFFVSIMIFSSVLNTTKIRQLYVELNIIDDKFGLLNVRFKYSRSTEIVQVLNIVLFTILFNLLEYFPQYGPGTTQFYNLVWIVNSLPEFINGIAIVSFVIVMTKIEKRFKTINKLIPDLIVNEKNIINTLESEMNNVFRLRLVNRIHEKLVHATTSLTEIHGKVLLLSFIVYFVTSCAHLRVIYLTFGALDNLIDFVVESLWLLFYLGKYYYVISACHNVTSQAKLSSQILRDSWINADHLPLKQETEAVARRFESRNLQLTACDFFAIDYPTFKMIVVALGAYLCLISQLSSSPCKIN